MSPGWRLGGWAEPGEYTLVMRRLPEKRMLPFLLDTRQVTAAMMRELAQSACRLSTLRAETCSRHRDPSRLSIGD